MQPSLRTNEEERMKEKRGRRSLFFPAFFVDKGMKKREEKVEHKISDKSVHTHVRTIKISIYGQPWDLKI